MILITERTRVLPEIQCEVCLTKRAVGVGRGVVVDERAVDSLWLIWVLSEGWSMSDESAGGPIAVCPEHQADPLIRLLRFAESRPSIQPSSATA
jgi:hypothetical protein